MTFLLILGWTAGCAAALYLFGCCIPCLFLFAKYFGRTDRRRRLEDINLGSTYFGPHMKRYGECVDFLNSLDSRTLTAYAKEGRRTIELSAVYYPNRGHKTAILMHGYHAEPEYCMGIWAKLLYGEGYSILLPCQRAHFESEGKYVTMGVREGDDTLAWAQLIHNMDPGSEILCAGISMGGSSVLFASDRLEEYGVRALIADCPVVSPKDQLLRVSRQRHLPDFVLVPPFLLAAALLAGTDFRRSCTENLKRSRLPVFLLHGDCDTTSSVASSKTLYEIAPFGSMLNIVHGSEHSVALPNGSPETEERVKHFLKDKFN